MREVIDLYELIDGLKKSGEYLKDVFASKGLEAGILYLVEGQEDIQTPHRADEAYFVLEGSGYIEIKKTKRKIRKGSLIFVPANTRHRFIRDQQDLIILYFLGG